MSDEETGLAAAIRQAIAPWFNYFTSDGAQPTHPERLDGATADVLAALAGRLLPPVVETRIEWGRPFPGLGVVACLPEDADRCANQPQHHRIRTITKYADKSECRTDWREVSP